MAISPKDVSEAFTQRPSFLVRAARPHDLHPLTELLARSFHSEDGPWGWAYPLLRLGIYEDLRNRIASPALHQAFLVAVPPVGISAEQRSSVSVPLAGAVEIAQRSRSIWQSRPERSLYISNLAVHVSYRRQGAARQLLAACDRLAIRWKIPDLYLHVLEDNYAAQQLYFQAGYRLLRTDAGIGTWLLGQPRQLYLHKRLPQHLLSAARAISQ
jgi:ribosomal protein S18 acetylase RimI-like enzyme